MSTKGAVPFVNAEFIVILLQNNGLIFPQTKNTWSFSQQRYILCLRFFLLYWAGSQNSRVTKLLLSKVNNSFITFCFRIIEIAGGREVYSQSRGKVAARKTRFLSASNTLANNDSSSESKVAVKKNNKSPNRPSVWELRSKYVLI